MVGRALGEQVKEAEGGLELRAAKGICFTTTHQQALCPGAVNSLECSCPRAELSPLEPGAALLAESEESERRSPRLPGKPGAPQSYLSSLPFSSLPEGTGEGCDTDGSEYISLDN